MHRRSKVGQLLWSIGGIHRRWRSVCLEPGDQLSLLPIEMKELLVSEGGATSEVLFLNTFKDINIWTGVRTKSTLIVKRIDWNVGAAGAVWVRT